MKNYAKKVIGAKTEDTYGVKKTISQADLIRSKELTISPIEADEVDRNYDGKLGAFHKTLANKRSSVSFSVDLSGSGTAGTAPQWGRLLLACGFRENITANTSVSYKPAGANFESVTMLFNIDGNDHYMRGCRGTVTVDLNAGAIPMLNFNFIGVPEPVTATAQLSGTFSKWTDGLVMNKTNTPTATLGGVSLGVETLSLDVGNDVQFVDRVNMEEVLIRNRGVSGSINIASTDIATKNWFAQIEGDTQMPLHIVHGVNAGNIVEVKAPKVQLTSPAYADNSGEVMNTFSLSLAPNAGNDEIEFIVR